MFCNTSSNCGTSDDAQGEQGVSDEEEPELSCGDEDDHMEALEVGGEQGIAGPTPGRRLWDARKVYPSGVKLWRDTANCAAALKFECPCGEKCLSKVGDVIRLYEHRCQLRQETRRAKAGGMRDALRAKLEAHYDSRLREFQQSFVVAGCAAICERAFAVACGVSEATFVRARADVTHNRPTHAGRVTVQTEKISLQRRTLDTWIRKQRGSMEGNKTSGNKWYTEKTTERQLWKRYVTACDRAQQPTIGSSRLLWELWKSHTEIIQVKPTGHAICDTCSDIHSERLALESLDPAEARERSQEIAEDAEAHHEFHTTERQYYDNAVMTATHHPDRVTCITIDAPTQHQFDLPSQARWKRDTSKKLDSTNRWQSKVEGVLDAGFLGLT